MQYAGRKIGKGKSLIEGDMNRMKSSRGVNGNDVNNENDDDGDNIKSGCEPLCVQDLQKLGWEKIAEMKISKTKWNQSDR